MRKAINSRDLYSSSDSSSSSSSLDSGSVTTTMSSAAPIEAGDRRRSEIYGGGGGGTPKYPTHHSFVVDMNNRPLYECDQKQQPRPSPKRFHQQQTQTEVRTPNVGQRSMAHLPPSEHSQPYFPPTSPWSKKQQQWQNLGGGCLKSSKVRFGLCVALFLIILLFYIVLLAHVIETRDIAAEIKRRVENLELRKNITRHTT